MNDPARRTSGAMHHHDRGRDAASRARVVVVDDHAAARASMGEVLRLAGYDVELAASAAEALQAIERRPADAVVTDLQMPGISGLELVRQLAARGEGAPIVMITAHATIATAVEAMRQGVFDYIEKPVSPERLEEVVARALEVGNATLAPAGQSIETSASASAASLLIGDSPAMTRLRQQIARIGATDETVLILGESGVGKELVARSLHTASRRASHPLVGLNCPALSAQLMESELFGHERGAFTGADAVRVGRFELADRGTILLDEVTEIEPPLQAKLLRVLQERCFERVGSSRTQGVDVRVLATSNRDLRAEVAAGRFRGDLYYRLAVVPLTVPPLRERRDDVPVLVDHFARQTAARLGHAPCRIDRSAGDLLVHYHWPGNIRELQNIVTRASVLVGDGVATADDLRPWLMEGEQSDFAPEDPTNSVEVGCRLADMEQRLIEATLDHYGGHRARAAQALGIGLRTLTNKLRSYGHAPRAKSFARAA